MCWFVCERWCAGGMGSFLLYRATLTTFILVEKNTSIQEENQKSNTTYIQYTCVSLERTKTKTVKTKTKTKTERTNNTTATKGYQSEPKGTKTRRSKRRLGSTFVQSIPLYCIIYTIFSRSCTTCKS